MPKNPHIKIIFNKLSDQEILECLHQFYKRQSNDLMIGFFFAYKNLDVIINHQFQFMKALYLEVEIPVKMPHLAHKQLPPILIGHFNRRIQILKETLHLIQPEVQQAWIKFEKGFKLAVVHKHCDH